MFRSFLYIHIPACLHFRIFAFLRARIPAYPHCCISAFPNFCCIPFLLFGTSSLLRFCASAFLPPHFLILFYFVFFRARACALSHYCRSEFLRFSSFLLLISHERIIIAAFLHFVIRIRSGCEAAPFVTLPQHSEAIP